MRRAFIAATATVCVLLFAGAGSAASRDTLSISPPGDMTATATTPCGQTTCAQVYYSFTVTGGTPPYNLICSLPSGGLFVVGTYKVGCMAQDSKGSSTPYASFTLTVNAGDVQPNPPEPPPPPLAISAPGDMTATATTPCGQTTCAQVYYSFTVTGGTPPYNLICSLPSGGLFVVGTYKVGCMAQDSKGSSTPYASFTLTVNAGDVQPNPPEPPPPPLAISAPADMTATATTPCGQTTCAQVYYSFTVTGGTPPYTLVCNLPSGGLFTVGAHTISCLAQDSKGNSTPNASFTLTVAAQAGGGGSSGGPYTPDVTGCTSSTCMANSLSFFELDGCPCDFGSFNWNRTSYALASQLPAGAIKPPLTIHTGNQTNDVAVSFTANGRPVAVASSAATGQQSGIAYTSGPIDLVSGTNVLTVSVDDPLHRLPATVYTWSFDYAAPPAPPSTTTTTNTSGTGTGSSGSTTTTGAPTGPEPANPTQPAPAVLAAIAVSAPVTTSRDGRRVLSFAVRSPAAASLHVTVLSQTGHTLLRFTARARKGRTRIVRTLPRQVNGRTHLTLRVTIGAHGRTRTIRVHVRA